ncbi:CehA/McbA family metallohydrolase [Actinomadura parmotrematis]|uniref:CehA/McbA family metallohydrolase n=1 Tax=Actinomadura parmotrematis TaxID=2864039 RepID=A0ABS7FZE4_9ACTN|nr:CehA/McbA family metallohydrolase [Actinomadura parmotrematis]MBW8485636.1 CehA/McbA family metallohydrolase [Actinomadura parmotrematis]
MCEVCEPPPAVADALDRYRRLLAEHGTAWGEDPIPLVRQIETSAYLMDEHAFWITCLRQVAERRPGIGADEIDARIAGLDLDEVIRDALAGEVHDNLAALRVGPGGARLEARRLAVTGDAPLRTMLLLDSARDHPVTVEVDGTAHALGPRGARIVPVTQGSRVVLDGIAIDLGGLARRVPAARIRVRAGVPCRWSVTGREGQGWYPDGAPHRVDAYRRPYFHGDDLVLEVPAEPLTVRVTRGMEHTVASCQIMPREGGETLVELAPERLYDAAAEGWYGGDMHVHMNWTGDSVGTPAQAAAVQHGEDLHVLNLVAGNVASDLVYDREALAHWAGRDLPWSDETHLARVGVEYRNDLLGHFYAFGVEAPPARFHTGFLGAADWPPNAEGARELRALGGLLGYSHPFHLPMAEDDPPGAALTAGRNCSAREIVADAALGLVDTLDVLNHSSIEATAAVYRRLLGAGVRLAATAGTDAMLSFQRRGNQSSPPGWERVYAKVDGPLTAASFAGAVRAGRTFATTGPWLELAVDGRGPGATLDLAPGDTITATARTTGTGPLTLQIRTADGVVAETRSGEATAELTITDPTYLVAVASGPPDAHSMHRTGAYAHTSPVYADVQGRHVAREQDVRWCLDYLDGLEDLIRRHARLDSDAQLQDHLTLLAQARAVYRTRL